MDQFFEKVTSEQDPFTKLTKAIPGWGGYVDRRARRDADKLLRDTVARRFEEHWKRASQLQSDMVSNGMIVYVDDMEKASIQLRTFIDKITTAPRRMRVCSMRLRSTRRSSRRCTSSIMPFSSFPTRSDAPWIMSRPAWEMKPGCTPPSAMSPPWPAWQ